jgi:hypothetical protein
MMPWPSHVAREFPIATTKASLPLGRRLAGYALAAAAAPMLTLVLASLRGQLDPTTDARGDGRHTETGGTPGGGLTMAISLPAVPPG